MVSDRKADANAANAQLSTGPRTEEGKARSSQNALKHGLTAKELIILDDEREEFEDFRVDFINDLAPEDTLETVLVNQALHAAWNLKRFRRLEADLMVKGIDPILDESSARTLDRLQRYAARAERSYFKAIDELRKHQTHRALWDNSQDLDECPVLADVAAVAKRSQQSAINLERPSSAIHVYPPCEKNFVPLRR
jgi:hypothetical protein